MVWMVECPTPGGHTEIVRLLIHANGDVERTDNAGLTPTNHAELHGHTQVVCLLRELRGWPKRQRSEGEVDEKLDGKRARLAWWLRWLIQFQRCSDFFIPYLADLTSRRVTHIWWWKLELQRRADLYTSHKARPWNRSRVLRRCLKKVRLGDAVLGVLCFVVVVVVVAAGVVVVVVGKFQVMSSGWVFDQCERPQLFGLSNHLPQLCVGWRTLELFSLRSHPFPCVNGPLHNARRFLAVISDGFVSRGSWLRGASAHFKNRSPPSKPESTFFANACGRRNYLETEIKIFVFPKGNINSKSAPSLSVYTPQVCNINILHHFLRHQMVWLGSLEFHLLTLK